MHEVFVYGTLLKDPNDTPWQMNNVQIAPLRGNSGFPISRKVDGAVTHGNIITVDDDGLKKLDWIEGVPNLYTREKATVVNTETLEEKEVYYYLYAKEIHEQFWSEYAVERWVDGINV